MITFITLLIIFLVLAFIVGTVLLACGATFLAVFGDLIICGLILWLIVRLFRRRK